MKLFLLSLLISAFPLFPLGGSPAKTKLKLPVIQLMDYLDAFRVQLMRILSYTLQL